jgi:uncharacterized cupin superfamily protein
MSNPALPEPGISSPRTGHEWNILGHKYWLRSWSESCFMFETFDPPGTSIPAHVHPDQDELIYVLEGKVEFELDGKRHAAGPGDIGRLPRNIPHGYFNVGDTNARMIFAVNPAQQLKQLFDALDNLSDIDEVYRQSTAHNVEFLDAGR